MGEHREAHAVERELRAEDVLTGALADTRKALSNGVASSHNRELALIDELLDQLETPSPSLPARLAASAALDGELRQALGDVLGSVARRLAPAGGPPADGAAAEAWQALTGALDVLFGSGARLLGRLPFMGDSLLELLLAEARGQLPEPEHGRRTQPGPAGRALASLAVSPKLRNAVAEAFGCAVTPTYDAVYLYDPPGSHVRTHVDTRDYELVVHLILEHRLPRAGGPGSALVVHLPGVPEPARLHVAPGEAVALKGRGTIHSWERLQGDEHRTMTAIGFASAS